MQLHSESGNGPDSQLDERHAGTRALLKTLALAPRANPDAADAPAQRAPGTARKRWRLLSGVALCVTAAGALAYIAGRPAAFEAPPAIVHAAASPAAIPAALQAEGFIVARRQATVSAETTGRIVDLLVSEGDTVRRGQPIAHLNTRIPLAQVGFAQAQLEVARRNADITRARIQAGRTILGRRLALAPDGWVSQASLDEARDNVAQMNAQLQSDLGNISVAQKQLDLDRQSLVNADIVAPFDGQVTAVSANVGEIVSPISAGGGFTRTGICTIADFSSLQVEVELSEQHLGRIAVGAPVTIALSAYPALSFTGRVAVITPAVDRATAAVEIRIAFDHIPQQALPGMKVDLGFGSGS